MTDILCCTILFSSWLHCFLYYLFHGSDDNEACVIPLLIFLFLTFYNSFTLVFLIFSLFFYLGIDDSLLTNKRIIDRIIIFLKLDNIMFLSFTFGLYYSLVIKNINDIVFCSMMVCILSFAMIIDRWL